MMPKLKDIMVEEVITVEANTTIRKAVKCMNSHEIGCLIVLQDGKPIGIITERDMLKRVLVTTRDPRAVEVGEVMSKPLLFVEPEKEVRDALILMFKHRIKKLPIIENGRLVGLVTLTDITNFMRRYLRKLPRGIDRAIDVTTQEPPVKLPEKKEKGPSKCAGYFGYLATFPKSKPIPQECLKCPRVLDCTMKTSAS
jgi:CBS domain-containing protein